jgi:hypothetical protein
VKECTWVEEEEYVLMVLQKKIQCAMGRIIDTGITKVKSGEKDKETSNN